MVELRRPITDRLSSSINRPATYSQQTHKQATIMNSLPSSSSSAFPSSSTSISEDIIHYSIYIPFPSSSSSSSSSSTTSSPFDSPETAATLITAHVENLLAQSEELGSVNGEGRREKRGWLWHKDPWELKVVPIEPESYTTRSRSQNTRTSSDSDSSDSDDDVSDVKRVKEKEKEKSGLNWRQLEGRMRIGDSVDDEWLVVWLLWEVSKRWKEVAIRSVECSLDRLVWIGGFVDIYVSMVTSPYDPLPQSN